VFCQACQGDPVNSATGEFFETITDIAIPGRGMELSLDRSYGSQRASVKGRFGYGWTDSYSMSITDDPVLPDTKNVNQENGSITRFTQQTNGSWQPESRVFATLAHNNDGTWTFLRDKTDKYSFSASGQLISESELNGETTQLTYTSGKLVKVTDPAGRSLTLTYTGDLVTKVQDTAGRTVNYAYDSSDNLISVTDLAGHTSQYGYDGNHQITMMITPKGGVTTNVYDSLGRVTVQTDPNAQATTWVYAVDSTLTGTTISTDPESVVTENVYSNGSLTSETTAVGTPLQATVTFEYDPVTNSRTKVTDPKGHSTFSGFDEDGNLLSQTDPLGNRTTWTYNSYNQVTSVTPPKSYGGKHATTTYSYDESMYSSGGHGNLTSTSTPILSPTGTQSGTQTSHYLHGDSSHPGDVTATIDPRGNTWTYTYDSAGNKTSQTAPATTDNSDVTGSYQTVTRWAYNTHTGWLTAQLDGRYTLSHPSATTCTTPAAGCTTYTYDSAGNILTIKDGNGHTTTNTYDANGNLASSKDQDGNTTSYTYDSTDLLTKTTRPDSTTNKNTYWPDGQLKTKTDGAGNVTQYTYDDLGNLEAEIDPKGRITTYKHDLAGNLLTKSMHGVTGCTPTAQIAGCTSYSYDAADQLTAIRYHDPNTPDVKYFYDAAGQRASMTDGSGTSTWSYNSLGDAVSTTNGAGDTISYTLDSASNITSIKYPATVGTVHQSYDPAGRIDKVTDWHGNSNKFKYDTSDNLTKTTGPGGTGLVASPDPIGSYGTENGQLSAPAGLDLDVDGNVWLADSYNNRIQQFSASGTFIRAVGTWGSAPGELKGPRAIVATSDGIYVTDTAGDRIQEFDTTGTYKREFGSTGSANGQFSSPEGIGADRQTGDIYVADTYNHRVQAFSATGTFKASYGSSGTGTGELSAPKDITVTGGSDLLVSDQNNNRIAKWISAAAITDTTSYDNADQITGITVERGASTLASFTYQRTPAGNVSNVTSTGVQADDHTYAYDQLQQLQTVDSNGYTYDQADRPTHLADGSVQTFDQAGQLQTVAKNSTTTSFTYDNRGNRTKGAPEHAAYTYTYDREDRLITAQTAVNSTYRYDGDGLRTSKTVGSTTTKFTWDQESADVALLLTENNTSYLYDPEGNPLEQSDNNGNTLWYHLDQQASTRLLTDNTNTEVGKANYDPYGQTTTTTGQTSRLGYNGQYTDTETGLIYLRARHYDPTTAQFLTVDPLVNQTDTPYNYSLGNPLNISDASGECPYGVCIWGPPLVRAAVKVGGKLLSRGAKTAGKAATRSPAVTRAAKASHKGTKCVPTARKPEPPIKSGSSGGSSAGKRFPKSVKEQTLKNNPDKCMYCGMKTGKPQVDHPIPRSRGGNATNDNAQTTCPHCNASKGARDFPVNKPPGFKGKWPPSHWKR
jgi:RHS repeat-associated protein